MNPQEKYGMELGDHTGELSEEERKAAAKHLMEQIFKIPAGEFEVVALCAKIKGEDRPLIAFIGNEVEIRLALSTLMVEVTRRSN